MYVWICVYALVFVCIYFDQSLSQRLNFERSQRSRARFRDQLSTKITIFLHNFDSNFVRESFPTVFTFTIFEHTLPITALFVAACLVFLLLSLVSFHCFFYNLVLRVWTRREIFHSDHNFVLPIRFEWKLKLCFVLFSSRMGLFTFTLTCNSMRCQPNIYRQIL